MADIIELLPDYVANQIAAGEVVQRPASAVKELLENAIDANASYIKLIIKDSGKTLIQVIDDGHGMSMTDARMAFERHATSKIKNTKDLFNITTKGFRGEALASVAAVSHLECLTKTVSDKLGTQIKIEGGKLLSQENSASSKGTSISIKNLFFNIPARRNFLKSDKVELTHIINEFHRITLAHSDVAFEMYNDSGNLFRLPKSTLKERIINIFGRKSSEKLIPVNENTDLVKVSGYIVKPEFSKRTRGEQFFFVNHRFIKSPYLNHATVSAFEGLLQNNYHPSYFLFLEINPATIDINIHPTKTEIKLENEQAVYAILRAVIKHSLGQFSVTPMLDFDKDASLEVPYKYKKTLPVIPKIEVDHNFNPFKKNNNTLSIFQNKKSPSWEALYTNQETQTKVFESSENPNFQKTTAGLTNNQKNYDGSSFQMFNKYIAINTGSQLLFIHQNRAHQRILFEDIQKQLSQQKSACQQLIFPLDIEFDTSDIKILKELSVYLIKIGFSINIDKNKVFIEGVPMIANKANIKDVLETLISEYLEQSLKDTSHKSYDNYIAKSLSKMIAIKTGDKLDDKTKLDLIRNLFHCKETLISPFKKPIFVKMSLEDIDKKF